MKFNSIAITLAALACTLATAAPGAAGEPPGRNIEVVSPWARATPPVAKVGAAYLEIKVLAADTLLGAQTPASDRVEIHATVDTNGVLQMRPLDALPILPGKPARLAPGSTHLMLIGLREPLVAGASFPLTLKFEGAGDVTVQVGVLRDAPAAPHVH